MGVGISQLPTTSIFTWIGEDTLTRNHMTQVMYLLLKEGTLAELGLEALSLKLAQHYFQPLQMLFHC